jgi:hypothetical protein
LQPKIADFRGKLHINAVPPAVTAYIEDQDIIDRTLAHLRGREQDTPARPIHTLFSFSEWTSEGNLISTPSSSACT